MVCKRVLNLRSEDKVCGRKRKLSGAGIVCESSWSRPGLALNGDWPSLAMQKGNEEAVYRLLLRIK